MQRVPGRAAACIGLSAAPALRICLGVRVTWPSLRCRVPSLAEVLRMVRRRIWDGSAVGVYIETKEPAFHAERGLNLEPRCAAHPAPALSRPAW